MLPFTKNQLPVILLGIMTMLIGSFTIHLSTNPIVQLVIQTLLVSLIFLAPLYFLKLENETVGFIKNLLEKAKKLLRLG
jgi:hypothetical protein